mmetsp:Transcript_19155/g.30464  ORF Transcript_19155/g.30464 Transcript_19155/m.30464 type:complete len:277 (-) Transcript_19155:61-891(-)
MANDEVSTATVSVEELQKTLNSLKEDLKRREKLCSDWKAKFLSKKTELSKIMAKQKAVQGKGTAAAATMDPENEEKILAEKEKKIQMLKQKLMEYKKQFSALKDRKAAAQQKAAARKAGQSKALNIRLATKTKSPTASSKAATKKRIPDAKDREPKLDKKTQNPKTAASADGTKTEKPIQQKPSEKKENGMKVGMKVSTIDGRRGIIRFLGKLHCARGIWVGMELFSGTGSNSGVVKGKKYFDCMPKKGIMVKLEKIKNPKTVEKVDEDGVEEIEL